MESWPLNPVFGAASAQNLGVWKPHSATLGPGIFDDGAGHEVEDLLLFAEMKSFRMFSGSSDVFVSERGLAKECQRETL